jgi:transcription antitermination factor NusG
MHNQTLYPVKASTQVNWYAAYTYPRAEMKVYNKLKGMGVETFFPLQKLVRQWSDRKKTIDWPLFPNYVFVRTTAVRSFELCRIPELVRFVSFDNAPVSIPEKDIEGIKKMLLAGSEVYKEDFNYKEGERVRVTTGYFTGSEGLLIKVNGQKRLVIQLEALRQAISVEVSVSAVVPIP